MAWIQIHQQLKDHRKLLAAADELEIEPVHMLGLIISFWLWALDNVPSGSLERINNRTIARAAQWSGDANEFVSAMINAGLFDEETQGNLRIHDWHEYAGKLIDQRESEKNRARRRRAADSTAPPDNRKATAGRPADVRQTSGGQPADVRQTSGGQPADVRQTSGGRLDQTILDNISSSSVSSLDEDEEDDEEEISQVLEVYENLYGELTRPVVDGLRKYCGILSPQLVGEVVRRCTACGGSGWAYVRTALEDCKARGVTLEQYQLEQVKRASGGATRVDRPEPSGTDILRSRDRPLRLKRAE